MPDLLQRSVDDMLAAMEEQFRTRWPNPWWPKGISAYDDCAACVSFYLFGLNSLGNPFYSYVSQIQTWGRNLGVWHPGHAGVQRGDVLAFDWDGDGDPDHTEIVVSVSSGGSIVTSRGTNSNPGDDMRDRTRSAGYILSYIRPPYPGTTSAADGGATLIPQGDEIDMATIEDLRKQADASNAAQTALIKEMLLRESRGRLYYCATPPAGLPQFVIIFWHRTPGQNNILYCNDGEQQARNARDFYSQTYDTVEQAKAAAIGTTQFQTLINLALGTDSAFTNKRATK
ncbi:CHAP domain-containing protein [Leifsonia sp. ZF2019]|uniref:CHAP domain-containing protein n=1 Tax=Leifsonia sp. ZF2019 TaxID=2781978 RepID=UPI001CC0094D|nr:CHAP domain-containing protein [Leifsonia sp. ZF2019]UAJ80144.1 CHAP domain-containing protein [Leifsonia sp. ZF2019]